MSAAVIIGLDQEADSGPLPWIGSLLAALGLDAVKVTAFARWVFDQRFEPERLDPHTDQ